MTPSIREQLEQREREILAPQASKSADSKGRLRKETEDPIRPAFQRDRDRIIHTKAFRRLKHKTQVFFSPTGDHYRTRLTHTLEVAQIARTIAKVLRLLATWWLTGAGKPSPLFDQKTGGPRAAVRVLTPEERGALDRPAAEPAPSPSTWSSTRRSPRPSRRRTPPSSWT